MAQNDKIQLFEDKRIRTAWDEEKEEWYFSIVDVCEVLSGTDNPRRYWSDLKRKLKSEGAVELYEKIVQLKMTAPDGKKRLTDVADTEQILRIIQSIPSPKAEPFKLWLAQVGRERIEETIDPELTIERALETYLKLTNRFRCHAVKTAWHQAFPGFPYPDFNGFKHGCQSRLRGVQRDLNPSFSASWRNDRMQPPFVRGSPSQKGAFS